MEGPAGKTDYTPSSPISLSALEPFLATHPDPRFAQYIHRGFQVGFRIGFASPLSSLNNARRNHPSAYVHPNIITDHIETEIKTGRLIRATGSPSTHINPIGLVPKSGQPGKFRLITDLSSPHDHSVNDGIHQAICSLKYAAIDQAAQFIRALGTVALLAKLDLQNAYRVVPVHPLDQHLLGIKWDGVVYQDTAMPFGLRSAPKIFTAVADVLAWAMLNNGVPTSSTTWTTSSSSVQQLMIPPVSPCSEPLTRAPRSHSLYPTTKRSGHPQTNIPGDRN